MRAGWRWVGFLGAVLVGACSDSTGVSTKSITTRGEAEAAFAFLRGACAQVDHLVSVDFANPMVVAGVAGTASVTGSKTSTSYSSSYSSSSSHTSNLTITFDGYTATSGPFPVSGAVAWYDYVYSRTACSSSSCASSYDHTESLSSSAVTLTFEYNGATYHDVIDIYASSPDYSPTWHVSLTNQAGTNFDFDY